MEYLKPKFTLPASTGKVTQEEWDRIFGDEQIGVCPHGKALHYRYPCEQCTPALVNPEGWQSDGTLGK